MKMESPVWKVVIRDLTTVLIPVVALGTSTMSAGSASAARHTTNLFDTRTHYMHPNKSA